MTEAGKEIFILGGPNGAGKTTAAAVLFPAFLQFANFLNADEIAREIAPADPDSVAFAAGRRMIERMREFLRHKQSFAFETTFSGKSYVRLLEECRFQGWRISLLYLWLPSPDDAIARVARRVRSGGHSVPDDVIRRRYYLGLANLRTLYLPLADEAEIYDNADSGRVLIAEKRNSGELLVRDDRRWNRLKEVRSWNG